MNNRLPKRGTRPSRPKWTYSGRSEGPRLPRVTRPSIRKLGMADIEVVFQPIVDLEDKRIFAYEALTRTRSNAEISDPAELFERASREEAASK